MAGIQNENKVSSITPLTLSMINCLSTDSEEIKYQNRPIDLIETTAKVLEMRESALRYEFSLIDPTGTITAFAYKKTNTSKEKLFRDFQLITNEYALIIGTMRKSQEISSFIVLYIQNLTERNVVDDFMARVIVAYIKNYKPVIKSCKYQEIIMQALMKTGFNPKGYTSNDIKNLIGGKVTLAKVEDLLNEMLLDGKLKNGADWNHYLINK
jgi:hypothetical protein